MFDASLEDLKTIGGIGEHSAVLIKAMPALYKAYAKDKMVKGDALNSVAATGSYLIPKFMGEQNEVVFVISLDNQGRVKNCSKISEGTANTARINNRKILELAFRYNATSVILAHNHPGGLANPSASDIETTINLVNLLENVQICLRDHFIIAGNEWFSMADSERYAHIFNY